MEQSFRKMSVDQRLDFLRKQVSLTSEEVELLRGKSLSTDIAEHLIENAIGYFQIPMGIATQFVIDDREYFIPMAVEETSIIAAASATAKWVSAHGTIKTRNLGNLIIGQIQLPMVRDSKNAQKLLEAELPRLIELANQLLPGLVNRGGGVRDIIVRDLPRPDGLGSMLVIHVLCNPCDAMGANLINQVCEGLKPRIEAVTGESVGLCILSNLVDSKLACAEVVIRNIDRELGEGIVEATLFAKADPYRAATHNKGVLNGIDPILIATGNDWRAVEAGVHAYASRSGKYQPVTDWRLIGNDLVGNIEIPMAVGTVGGVTRIHPTARTALKILGIEHAEDLARICAAVGLVQNLGALKALSTVGIVRGHMDLHAANLALAAGSNPDEVPKVRKRLAELLKAGKSIGISVAQEILREVRAQPTSELQARL
jgi:hydroxymethylglutaryl-CoA reductase